MKSASEPAYVLHSWDWSESSLIVDLFTRSQGRVVVVAKGAKRPTSQMRAVLLPFQRLHVAFGSRRTSDAKGSAEASEVHTLRHAERAGGGPMPAGEALLSGFYLNELLMKLLAREDAHPAAFDGYAAVMPVLAQGEGLKFEAALRAFELLLLRECGLLPDLSRVTATQQPVAAGGRYGLDPERGVVERTADAAMALDGELLRAIEQGLSQAGAAERLDALIATRRNTSAAALKLSLRELLQYHLGSTSHGALRTRALMQDLSRLPHLSPRPAR